MSAWTIYRVLDKILGLLTRPIVFLTFFMLITVGGVLWLTYLSVSPLSVGAWATCVGFAYLRSLFGNRRRTSSSSDRTS